MYITIELTAVNSDRVLDYLARNSVCYRLYIQDPCYSCCLVSADGRTCVCLGLLA